MTFKLYSAIVACALFAAPVSAQSSCGGTADAYAMLAERFGETRIWIGQTDNGVLAELWVNSETGTWSLLGSDGGVTCLVSQGVGYSTGAPA